MVDRPHGLKLHVGTVVAFACLTPQKRLGHVATLKDGSPIGRRLKNSWQHRLKLAMRALDLLVCLHIYISHVVTSFHSTCKNEHERAWVQREFGLSRVFTDAIDRESSSGGLP